MLNGAYFKHIDTEAKAYLVGLLLADGCITKHHGIYRQIQLHISSNDIYLAELLKEETESNRKIYISPNGERCMFRDSSDEMVRDLSRFGIVPNKTGNEQPNFNDIPDNLLHHTIRGLIDGDGWLSISNTSTGRVVTNVGLCGSYDTCFYVSQLLFNKLGVGPLSPSKVKDKDCYKIGYSSLSDNKKIIKYIYSNASVGLKRKYEKALDICNMQNKN